MESAASIPGPGDYDIKDTLVSPRVVNGPFAKASKEDAEKVWISQKHADQSLAKGGPGYSYSDGRSIFLHPVFKGPSHSLGARTSDVEVIRPEMEEKKIKKVREKAPNPYEFLQIDSVFQDSKGGQTLSSPTQTNTLDGRAFSFPRTKRKPLQSCSSSPGPIYKLPPANPVRGGYVAKAPRFKKESSKLSTKKSKRKQQKKLAAPENQGIMTDENPPEAELLTEKFFQKLDPHDILTSLLC